MAHNVYANTRNIIHKGSGDKAIGGPDVCKTQVGTAVVPIPYPNFTDSGKLTGGSTSVKIQGKPAMMKGSKLASSNGDDVGSLGGIISGVNKSEAEAITYSFNVKIEGKNVVRGFDALTHNKKNAMGTILGSVFVSIPTGEEKVEEEKCKYCKKEVHKFSKKLGNNIGSSNTLSRRIIPKISDHRWYTGGWSLAAHHLICSEAVDNDDWSNYCLQFGYDINCKENGVMLPMRMPLACQLHAPLHRGNHDKGKGEGVSYPEAVKKRLEKISNNIKSGNYCDKPQGLIDEMNDLSAFIIKKVNKFKWTLTGDGRDYDDGGIGCAGVLKLGDKTNTPCPAHRKHNLKAKDKLTALPKKSTPLEIGK